MEQIIKYTDYLNEATVEVEETDEGVYVLTLNDIKNIVGAFTDQGIDDEAILEELANYKFVKVEDPEIKEIGEEPVEEIEELSSDDENPTFIKKFEQS